MEYELPWLGVAFPWVLDYLFLCVGCFALYNKVFRALYLIIVAQMRTLDLSMYGKGTWAIVTGSTGGIGKAFAEALAAQGFNLYLISRSQGKLDDVANELKAKFPISVKVRAWDFADCAGRLNEFMAIIRSDVESMDVSILVNNVGVFTVGYFHKQPEASIKDMCAVNCLAVVYMTRLLLAKLKSRKLKSGLINISSLSSLVPMPGLTQYSASKRFDSVFTKCLSDELASTNIVTMNLRPGFVPTALTAQSKISTSPFKKLLGVPTAKACAEGALRDLGLSLSYVGDIKHKLQGLMRSAVPEPIMANIVPRLVIKAADS